MSEEGVFGRLRAVQAMRRYLRGAPPPPVADRDELEDAPLDVLASKVLFDHLRNRQQLLGPPPTALGHLDQTETELLIRAAVAAAQAGGHFDEDRERRLRAALSANGIQVEEHGFVAAAIRAPVPVGPLLDQVGSPHLAALFYGASLLAVDKLDPVDRSYLAFIAARLRLSPEVLTRLHGQYGLE